MHKFIKRILITSIVLSLAPTFLHALAIPLSIYEWFALSSFGLSEYRFFQFFTYPLLFPFNLHRDAFSILSPIFAVFLARLANFFYEQQGMKRLAQFYFIGSLFTGLILWGIQAFFATPFVYIGSQPFFYGLLTYTLFLIPDVDLLFFVIPMKGRYFLLFGLGMSLFSSMQGHEYISFIATISGTIFGYIFALIALRRHSPFALMKTFENFIFWLLGMFRIRQKCVIVDFKTGRKID